MASPARPKSPHSPGYALKDGKEESFWEKVSTIGRKKKIKEGKCVCLLKNRSLVPFPYLVMCQLCCCLVGVLFILVF